MKGYDSCFNGWIDKKDIIQMSKYFPELKTFRGRVKGKLDISNYATKADLKDEIDVDTSKCAKKIDLASLESEVDKLDIGKLEKVPTCLKSLKGKVDKLDAVKLTPVSFDLI